jgi:hypothetical protein
MYPYILNVALPIGLPGIIIPAINSEKTFNPIVYIKININLKRKFSYQVLNLLMLLKFLLVK